MRKRCVLMAGVVLCATSIASAGIIEIGMFTGDRTETFEAIGAATQPDLPIFEGAATMVDSLAGIGVSTWIWNGTGGELTAYEGTYFGGTPVGSTIFTFDTPVIEFGGVMATVGEIPNGTAIFRDAEGHTLHEVSMVALPVTWRWQGWHSDEPFTTVEIVGDGLFGNRPMQYDNLQVTFVPEPAALSLIAVAGVSLLWRRRR